VELEDQQYIPEEPSAEDLTTGPDEQQLAEQQAVEQQAMGQQAVEQPMPDGPDFSFLFGEEAQAMPRVRGESVIGGLKRAFKRDGAGTGDIMKRAQEAPPVEGADAELVYPQMQPGEGTPEGPLNYDQLLGMAEDSLLGSHVDPGRTEYRNISLDYIDSQEKILSLLDSNTRINKMHGSGPPRISHEQTKFEAMKEADLRADLTMIMGASPDTTWNRKQLVRARSLLDTFGSQVYEKAVTLIEPSADGGVRWKRTATTEDKMQLQKRASSLTAVQRQVQMVVKEVARALNSMKIPVAGDPKLQRDFNEQFYEAAVDDKALLQFAKMVVDTKGDISQINKLSKASLDVSSWEMVMEHWYGMALSRPSTQLVNIGGNLMVPPYLMLEQGAAATYSHARRAWHLAFEKSGLKPAPDTIEDINTYGEVAGMAYGWLRGNLDAVKLLSTMWKASDGGSFVDPTNIKLDTMRTPKITGDTFSDLVSRQNWLNKPTMGVPAAVADSWAARGLMDLWGRMVRMPGRSLQTADDYFKIVAYSTKLHQRAIADTEMAVRSGEFDRFSDEYYDKINQTIMNPSQNVHMDASDMQKLVTFTRELNDVSSRKIHEVIRQAPILQPLLPFLRVSTNIAKFAGDRSPLPLFADAVNIGSGVEYKPGAAMTRRTRTYEMLKAGGAQRDLAVTRVAGGTMGAVAVWTMMNNQTEDGTMMPLITGAGPKDHARRRAWQKTGWKPFSIYVGGKYIPYDRLDPFGMWLGMAATTFEIWHDTYNDRKASSSLGEAIIFGFSDTLSQKTYMQNLATLIDVISGEKPVADMGYGFLSTLAIPNISRTVREETDMYYRQRRLKPSAKTPDNKRWEKFLADLIERTPGWSDTLPPDVNWAGEPLLRHKQLGAYDIPPIFYGEASYDDLGRELLEKGIVVNDQYTEKSSWEVPTKDGSAVYDVLMDDDEGKLFYEYRVLLGKQVHSNLSNVVRSDTYKNADADLQRSMLMHEVSLARNLARQEFVSRNRKRVNEFVKLHSGLVDAPRGQGVAPRHSKENPPGM
jgi:hypothetical protein